VTPTIIQAVAQTRVDDFMRVADRRRRVSAVATARDVASSALKSIRPRRRLRLGIA
jgi:cation transport regulator ChaB